MDLTHAIAVSKASAGHVRYISSAFSRPLLQKQIARLPTLSASKGKRGVNSRQLVVKAASSDEYQFGSGGSNMVDANMILVHGMGEKIVSRVSCERIQGNGVAAVLFDQHSPDCCNHSFQFDIRRRFLIGSDCMADRLNSSKSNNDAIF